MNDKTHNRYVYLSCHIANCDLPPVISTFPVGAPVGETVGELDGTPVGEAVGDADRAPVGETVRESVGSPVGEMKVGDGVGDLPSSHNRE
jgi:hypothetical protein